MEGTEGALERDFHSVKNLIAHIARRFARARGGDPDELYAEGCLEFLLRYDKFDPSRGTKLSTWLYTVLWRHFNDLRRSELRRERGERKPEDELPARRNGSVPIRRVVEGLGPKALELLDVVLCPPADIAPEHRVAHRAPRDYRRAVRDLLVGLGWTPDEVGKAFAEISRALRDP